MNYAHVFIWCLCIGLKMQPVESKAGSSGTHSSNCAHQLSTPITTHYGHKILSLFRHYTSSQRFPGDIILHLLLFA